MTKIRPAITRSKNTPLYNISAAAKLSGLAIYTIRWLETNKLLYPKRSSGGQRIFSDADIERLREIRELLRRHVNVQGIRVILEIRSEYGSVNVLYRRRTII